MNSSFQVEELGLVPLDASEIILIDGGDTVNTSYHNGASQLDLNRIVSLAVAVGDFFSGFADGLTGR